MILFKFLAFLCVAACCAFTYTLVEYRQAKRERKPKKLDRLVEIAIVSVFTLMFTALPLAYYALCNL